MIRGRILWIVMASLALAGGGLTRASAGAAASKPNILVIMSDDMGYSDIGCYGGEIRTPNLDRLAQNGLRFTQFYNTARCCPTRASLLSGLYPHQAGVGHMMNDRGYDGYRGELNRKCVTIAEALKPAGYATYMTGKWHITKATQPEGPKDNWPLQRGFDRYYGTITGAGSFWDPSTLVRDNTMISAHADPEYRPQRYYYTDALSEHASRFVRDHRKARAGSPFFMYVAYTAAHWPMHAPEEDIAKYRGRFDRGYAATRQARVERMRQLGLLDPKWTVTPNAVDWDSVKNREWETRCMEVYAAMIDRMDQGIGRIVDALKDTGQLDNTLILFLQDNGGCAEPIGRGGNTARADRPTLPPIKAEELLPGIQPKQTRDGYPVLTGSAVMPGPADTYIAYGEGWANVSNTPFREYKHWVHEGGISSPLVAHWPRGIRKELRGGLAKDPSHLIDIMATSVDISSATYPTERAGQRIHPLEGRSLVPAFQGRPIQREAIYWEHEGNRAVRTGDWKLVAKGERGPWELYDIASDRTEMKNLAAEQPERVRVMAALWQRWAERANVLPLNPQQPAAPQNATRRFELKQGDSLTRAQAPAVQGKAFRIRAVVLDRGEGVLVAHGGSAEGYALYFKEGKAVLALRRGNQLATAELSDLPAAGFTLEATVGPAGELTLAVGGRRATGKAAGPLERMPVDGLQVGRDEGGSVGDYTGPFPFTGKLAQVVIELL